MLAPLIASIQTFFPPTLIAQQLSERCSATVTDQEEFFQSLRLASDNYQSVQESWTDMWAFIFSATGIVTSGGTTLYWWLSQAGQALAVGTLLFFMLQWFRDINEGNLSRPISELIWPLLVAFLLGVNLPSIINNNSINPLAAIIQGLRADYVNWEQRLYNFPGIVGPQSIRETYAKTNAVVNTQGIIQGFFAQCTNAVDSRTPAPPTGQEAERCNCLQQEILRSENLILAYQQHYQDDSVAWWNQRLGDLRRASRIVGTAVDSDGQPLSSGDSEALLQAELAPSGLLGWVRDASSRSDSQGFLQSVQLGFRQTLEAALLFTAMLGPVALGVSLLPVPVAQKAIVSWLSGLGAVASAKLFYYLVVGLTSQVLLNLENPPIDISWFAVFINTIAPLLSLGLATGGGAALFNGLNNFVTFTQGRI